MTFPKDSESQMLSKLQQRRATLTSESAFTLIELLIVLIIISALLAIAFAAYFGFENRSLSTVAAADVRQAIPDATMYYDNHNSYTGMTPGSLQAAFDSGLVISSSGSAGIVSAKPEGAGRTYCISAVDNDHWAHFNGPGGRVTTDPSTVTTDPCP